jgi:hypothetical protein
MLRGMTEELAVNDISPAEPEPGRARRPWVAPMLTGLAGVVVGAGAVGLAWGLSGSDAKPAPAGVSAAPFNLTGSMTLTGSNLSAGTGCVGARGYDDISEGTAVTVYDASGQVVATGSLGSGYRLAGSCKFTVVVTGVPVGPKFYQVEVSHRGKISISAEDARAGKFAASLG